MDYHVSFFQDSWEVKKPIRTEDVVQRVIDTRDAAIKGLQLPGPQEGKVDGVESGIWLKVRTDRPTPGSTTTAFVSVKDKGLHRPIPFQFFHKLLGPDQIRLLELRPGSESDPLRGRVIEVDLERAPAYTALSYVWGSPEAADTILLGHVSEKPERIVKNLSCALKQMRLTEKPRLIWTDAICIDQNNMVEKSSQVSMMGKIFASATEVLIWLGNKTGASQIGMKVLRYLAEGRGFEENPPWETLLPELVRQGLEDILQRGWFHRIWTVQEAALSSRLTTVKCGEYTTSWKSDVYTVSLFARGLKFAAVSRKWTENGLAGAEDLGLAGVSLDGIIDLLEQQLQQIRRRQNQRAVLDEPDLLDLAYSFKDKLSSDPRDMIFAIHGLAEIRGLATGLSPDYSKSVNEVYDDFRRLLRESAAKELERVGYGQRPYQVDHFKKQGSSQSIYEHLYGANTFMVHSVK